MHRAVIENLVDLVGEQHQLVLASQLHHAFQDFLRIDRAGGVVRADQTSALVFGVILALMSARSGHQLACSSQR